MLKKKLKKHTEELELMNEKLRLTMNKLQEKDQRLLDAMMEVEKTKDRLNTIIQQMGEGLIVINDEKEIELMNDRAKEMLGYGADQEIPLGYKKFFVLHLWKELGEGRGKILKKELRLERPKETILLITLARFEGKAGKGGFIAVLRDITFEKQVEKMKSDFVANVSHEIRSPMAPMKDALGLVLDGTAGPLTDNQKKFLTLLGNNMDRLTRLINDLLDLSKIEAGKMGLRKEHINVSNLLRDVVESIHVYADKKRISLSIEVDDDLPEAELDKDRITQVVINLVMNAIKFTPEGGSVVVASRLSLPPKADPPLAEVASEGSATSDQQPVTGGNHIVISVKDTGPGMTKMEADALFNRFKQLVTPQAIRGTGLGLEISKAIVEMHGGRIWVESEKGGGSCFKFSLLV